MATEVLIYGKYQKLSNILKMIEFVKTDDNQFWLILENANGGTLYDFLLVQKKLEPDQTKNLIT